MKMKWVSLMFLMSTIACAEKIPFAMDQGQYAEYMNEFWDWFGICERTIEGVAPETKVLNLSTTVADRMAKKIMWTDYQAAGKSQSYRDELMEFLCSSIKVTGVDGVSTNTVDLDGFTSENGYLWLTPNRIVWFGRHYHYDQLPRYINACHDLYMWTADNDFLTIVMPYLEGIMDFMIQHRDSTKLFALPGLNDGCSIDSRDSGYPTNTVAPWGHPSHFYDTVRSGYRCAWINAAFYQSLKNMVDLEAVFADQIDPENAAVHLAKKANYQIYAGNFPAKYSWNFWDFSKGRFVGWVDKNGGIHDYGFTYVNLEALANGLGDLQKADKVFSWLDDGGAEATWKGTYAGSTNIYQMVAVPRVTTERISESDFDDWSSDGKRNALGENFANAYGNNQGDGGSALFFVYLDTMARLRWLDADNAYEKFTTFLKRAKNDPYCMALTQNSFTNSAGEVFNNRLVNVYGEGNWELLVNGALTGIAVTPMLYGFMGVSAEADGLHIHPKLPGTLFSAACSNVSYRGVTSCIRVARGDIVRSDEPEGDSWSAIVPGQTRSRSFLSPSEAFNEVHVQLKTDDSGVSCDLILYQSSDGGVNFEQVAAGRRLLDENAWVYLPCPEQPPGLKYNVEISNVNGGTVYWRHDPGSEAAKSFKAAYCRYSELIDSSSFSGETVCDECLPGNMLRQVFSVSDSFSKISVKFGTWATQTSGFTLILERKISSASADYRTVAMSTYRNLKENWTEMTFADQPPGEYRLTMTEPSGQKIGWYRRYDGNDPGGAYSNDVQLAGDYLIRVYQGSYRINILAEQSIDTTKNAGESYIYNPQSSGFIFLLR